VKLHSPTLLTIGLVLLAITAPEAGQYSGLLRSTGLQDQPHQPDAQESQRKKPRGSKSKNRQDANRELTHGGKNSDAPNPSLTDEDLGAQSYALVIGISKYKNLRPEAQLQFADEDARALRDFLVGPRGGFKPENTTLLVNEDATLENIYRGLRWLQQRASLRDLAFVFFAGHGFVDQFKQGYLIAYDTDPEDLLVTGVEMDKFNTILRNLRSRSTVIFSDACHSGTIGDLIANSQSGDSPTNLSAKSFGEPVGRIEQSAFILSASSPTQSSWEVKELKHGLFTYYVLDGLGGQADRNQDGLVTAKELYEYVATQVQRAAEKDGHSQVPEFNSQYDYTIPLAFLSEPGEKLYREWFESDPFVTRYAALFEEALKNNQLIKPERRSAWDYYVFLTQTPRTPTEKVTQMREQLLERLNSGAESVMTRVPGDTPSWNEASSWLEKAYDLSRDRALQARASYCIAMAAYTSGELRRAERECETAFGTVVESHLKDPLLCLRIAQLYRKLDKLDKALDSYKRAVEESPQAAWISEYAEVLVQLSNLPEAEAQLRKARDLDRSYVPALRLLARVLLMSDSAEKAAEAVQVANEARSISPSDVDTEEVYGWALLKNGDPFHALEPLRQVSKMRLGDEARRDDALLRLSDAYAQIGHLDQSVSALREAQRRDSRNSEVYEELAKRLEQLGDLDGAIAAAQKATELTGQNSDEKSKRLRSVAEYLEREGRLSDAASRYKEASRLSTDVGVNTALENHYRVLSYRAGQSQGTEATAARMQAHIPLGNAGGLLIVPGGRGALKRLSGVDIKRPYEPIALATIFDACLRDPDLRSKLEYFYDRYPELAEKLRSKGVSGPFELPAENQPLSEAAKEALKFFGVRSKNGRREIDRGAFERRRVILEALGGDAEALQTGVATSILLRNDEFAVTLGMNHWIRWIHDGQGTKPDHLLLAFVRDSRAMRLYVGISMLPEEAAQEVANGLYTDSNKKDIDDGIYFVAPYLRCTKEGSLHVPGGQQGQLNWQRVLKANPGLPAEALRGLFKRDNGKALYLFAALSSAGEVGDLIASTNLFDKFYSTLKNGPSPSGRESFDLIDLVSLMYVDGTRLRLPKAAELLLVGEQSDADPISVLISKLGSVSPGAQIPLVKQLAAIASIERERPDWVSTRKAIDVLAQLVSDGHELQLETPLDLRMDWSQVERYLAQIDRLDAISTPSIKQYRTRMFQATFELLRLLSRNGALEDTEKAGILSKILALDPGSDQYAYNTLAILLEFSREAERPAIDPEEQLLSLLARGSQYRLPRMRAIGERSVATNSEIDGTVSYEFDQSSYQGDQIANAMKSLNVTRLGAVVRAVGALSALDKSPSDETALKQLQAAVAQFNEPEPPPVTKKEKGLPPTPSLNDSVSQLAVPVTPSTLTELRLRIAPFVGDALLGAVSAAVLGAMADHNQKYPELRWKREFDSDPWAECRIDVGTRNIQGAITHLSSAVADWQAETLEPGEASETGGTAHISSLVAAMVLNSYHLVDHSIATGRGLEYVARTMDLGEDVLGRCLLSDQAAWDAVNREQGGLSPYRARRLRALLEGGEVRNAITCLSLSELYMLGRRYFQIRLARDSLPALVREPGALGALARIESEATRSTPGTQDGTEQLKAEIRQFGILQATRTSLTRLDLRELESYEQALSFETGKRFAERLQDFKLAMARACYRDGLPASLSLSLLLARPLLHHVFSTMYIASGGRMYPEHDWQDFLSKLQGFDQTTLVGFINQLTEMSYARPSTSSRWDEEITSAK
jgi:tetratricopeptide (TPR) repeat protein